MVGGDVSPIAAMPWGDRREVDRDDVSYSTWMTGMAQPETVHILNISACGLMALSDAAVTIGQQVWFDLPTLAEPVEARIIWAPGGRIGAQFLKPIGLASYLLLLAELVKQAR